MCIHNEYIDEKRPWELIFYCESCIVKKGYSVKNISILLSVYILASFLQI